MLTHNHSTLPLLGTSLQISSLLFCIIQHLRTDQRLWHIIADQPVASWQSHSTSSKFQQLYCLAHHQRSSSSIAWHIIADQNEKAQLLKTSPAHSHWAGLASLLA